MRKDLVIIRVDGGIASQISFVALGLEFESRGYKVKYDLSWFDEFGNGIYNEQNGYDRSYNIAFDIPKAFPDIKYEIASRDEIEIYRKKYINDEGSLPRTWWDKADYSARDNGTRVKASALCWWLFGKAF